MCLWPGEGAQQADVGGLLGVHLLNFSEGFPNQLASMLMHLAPYTAPLGPVKRKHA